MGQSAGQSGKTTPRVSVIVPYYKRADVFKLTLASVLEQDYADREVIIVDNHSEDGVREIIETCGADVRLIELPANQGACAARNAGIRAARGEILVFADDDMGLITPFEVSKAVKTFDAKPGIHALAFQVCDPETGRVRLREWCHARYWKDFGQTEFETLYFCEGACAFRRDVFETAGFYYEPFFYGLECWDLTIRLFNHGFRILYCPSIRSWHRPSPHGRSVERQYYYFTRNYVWTAYKDYTFLAGIRFLLPRLMMMLYFTLRAGAARFFLRGLWHGLAGLKSVAADRTPMTGAARSYIAELERWRPSWRVRFAKHAQEPQL